MSEFTPLQHKFIIPVYLNQNIVFDLIAMMQGGFSTVTKVTSENSDTSEINGKITGNFGLSSALSSLFKIDVSSELSGNTTNENAESFSEERIHTPASLLHQLLKDKIFNGTSENIDDIKSGDFVSFNSTLKKPSLLHVLDASAQILPFVDTLSGSGDTPSGNKKSNQTPKKPTEMEKTFQKISIMRDLVVRGDTFDLIAQHPLDSRKVVLTLDKSYLADEYMANLLEGDFKIFGKVIRNVRDHDVGIDLLRKSALAISPDIVGSLVKAFNDMNDGTVFSFPHIETMIEGPALHIIPIAVFA